MVNELVTPEEIVSDADVTVLIQGPLYLDSNTKGANVISCIESVRKFLPKAKIIVSTWDEERSHHEQLQSLADYIIYSACPAPIVSYGREDNVTRQIESTQAGLIKVDTLYVLKIRANILLNAKTTFFRNPGNKLNIPALISDPVKSFMLFTFPDFIQFGKLETMRLLWNIKIEQMDYFLDTAPPSVFDIYSFPHKFKFAPEQRIGIAWARNRHGASPLIQHQFDVNYSDFIFWKDIINTDFNLFSPVTAGFDFYPKRYTEGTFIDATGEWLRTPSRKQFSRLFIRKYMLFVFAAKWLKHAAKYALFSLSKRAYWVIHNSMRR